jgi:Na+-translocating ferredoxin:NAD+ oxidoreductase RnfA subunit
MTLPLTLGLLLGLFVLLLTTTGIVLAFRAVARRNARQFPEALTPGYSGGLGRKAQLIAESGALERAP